jgi:hypothetical protein
MIVWIVMADIDVAELQQSREDRSDYEHLAISSS